MRCMPVSVRTGVLARRSAHPRRHHVRRTLLVYCAHCSPYAHLGGTATMVTGERPMERNLALELVRVTEMAAMAAGRWMGRGDKIAADQAAVDAMRYALASVDMDGIVVIGEGEKDEAPMLFNGERIGN